MLGMSAGRSFDLSAFSLALARTTVQLIAQRKKAQSSRSIETNNACAALPSLLRTPILSMRYQFLSAARCPMKESSAGHIGRAEAGSRSLDPSPLPA